VTHKQYDPAELEQIAIEAVRLAAKTVAQRYGTATALGTKSSATDVVTKTDIDSENIISELLRVRTPDCGIVGEETGASELRAQVQWVVDPLDGTVNFLYALPTFAVSVAAAVDGEFVAGAVIDVLRNEVFSAHVGGGARRDGIAISVAPCDDLAQALVLTGFSYSADLRAEQAAVMGVVLPAVRDIRCFGSAALELCWVACGRANAYFERDIKIWDWAGASVIAAEAGVVMELPCPENRGLFISSGPPIFAKLRTLVV
jgi:myo-inositol-1(or 4)-monophosphatase